MIKGHHRQVKYHPPLLHNFRWLDIKATPGHHSIIQKEVCELLAKGNIEPFTVWTGFNSNIFVAPKHMGGLHPTLNLK